MSTSRRAKLLALAATVAICFVIATLRPAVAVERIVNGLNTQGFPTTGALLYSMGGAITESNASTWCSGTLIGCGTFLTAAHCVDDTVASHYWVYLQHAGLHAVSSISVHPGYTGASGRDVAIIHLANGVTGIDPTTINTTHDLDAMGVGLTGTIAGFGQTSGSGNDYGVKRYGDVVTADCDTGATGGEGNDKLVCWDYANPVGPAGEDSNTCNGDSGGPLFMDFSGNTEVVGVTSSGTSLSCLPTDHSWDASIYYNAAWITGQLGADSTSPCGSFAAVGDPDVTVHQNSGSLSAVNPDDSFSVDVTDTPQVLRFTLNGTDNGSFNPDFFVKEGAGASAASFDCKGDGTSVFGACEFLSPAAGIWSVFVQRAAGAGEYQVTTTVFGGNPPVCGNNIVESGEECDGTSDSACPGDCQGDCSCLQPCSNGDLNGVKLSSDVKRFSYRGWLFDGLSSYVDLDPRDDDLTFRVSDVGGSVSLAIPAADVGWVRADPVSRKYTWKGDSTLDGLRTVKLRYRFSDPLSYWILTIRGRGVTGADTIVVENVLDFELGFDGTCHLQSW